MGRPEKNNFSILGLCMRAGKLVTGAQAVEKSIKHGEGVLALIDAAASDGTKKAIHDACEYMQIEYAVLPEGALSRETGKANRMAAAVTDASFAKAIKKCLEQTKQSDTIEGCI
ncbi:MAG: 50S ribosomal protein L7ae [Clostridiales bacterium]|nr:50S ribosomal protein L7ae [Clostridiales bacterium]